ncbi:MAG: hypothetical protein H7Y00_09465 [Fimbriimonadaceae bacterium]|nr:hypothetical protein [Chitinophagales bacterium]
MNYNYLKLNNKSFEFEMESFDSEKIIFSYREKETDEWIDAEIDTYFFELYAKEWGWFDWSSDVYFQTDLIQTSSGRYEDFQEYYDANPKGTTHEELLKYFFATKVSETKKELVHN